MNSRMGSNIRDPMPGLAEVVFHQPDRILTARALDDCVALLRDIVADCFET